MNLILVCLYISTATLQVLIAIISRLGHVMMSELVFLLAFLSPAYSAPLFTFLNTGLCWK